MNRPEQTQPARRGAVATVKIAPSNQGGVEIEFTSTRPEVRGFSLPVPKAGNIPLARGVLDEGLRRIKDEIPSVTIDGEKAVKVAVLLAQTGQQMFTVLFGRDPGIVESVQRFWRKVLRCKATSQLAPIVECVGNDDLFPIPIEYLPLLDVRGCDEIYTTSDLPKITRAFIGFSFIVRRQIATRTMAQDNRTRPSADGKIAIGYIRHDGLDGQREEYEWLAACENTTVSPPFPNGRASVRDLAERLLRPTTHIEHFSCHCYTSAAARRDMLPTNFELQLRGAGHDLYVTLGQLQSAFLKLDVKPRGNPKPLIVLNACGASTIDATNSVSFPSVFLENHNPGVLGTEIVIPDRVATAFSKAFYTKLLSGATLGESVLHARRQLWEEHSNPLGLTYSVYGNADLQVTTPKEETP